MNAVAYHDDPHALGAIYRRYHRDVRLAIQRSMVDASDVEDVLQTVFLSVPKIAARFEGGSCRAWLCGIATRFALRHRRTIARRLRTKATFASAPRFSERNDPETSTINSEQRALIHRALAGLPPKKRAAFMLVEVLGLSTQVAAKLQDVPPATLRTRLFHAKQDLRRLLLLREGR